MEPGVRAVFPPSVTWVRSRSEAISLASVGRDAPGHGGSAVRRTTPRLFDSVSADGFGGGPARLVPPQAVMSVLDRCPQST